MLRGEYNDDPIFTAETAMRMRLHSAAFRMQRRRMRRPVLQDWPRILWPSEPNPHFSMDDEPGIFNI